MDRYKLHIKIKFGIVYLCSDSKLFPILKKIPFIDDETAAIKICEDLIHNYNLGNIDIFDIIPATCLYDANIPNHYKKFVDESTYLGCMPALNNKHMRANSYYSVRLIDNPSENATPTFYIPPGQFYKEGGVFMFDSERSRLEFSKRNDSNMYHQILDNIHRNPYVLFFLGCDDGSVGLRFPTKKNLEDYVNSLCYFEEVFENEYLQYYN